MSSQLMRVLIMILIVGCVFLTLRWLVLSLEIAVQAQNDRAFETLR